LDKIGDIPAVGYRIASLRFLYIFSASKIAMLGIKNKYIYFVLLSLIAIFAKNFTDEEDTCCCIVVLLYEDFSPSSLAPLGREGVDCARIFG
ncbi:MAG: hypothetical protein IKM10_02300, partial [Bacteroidaceae bacterium]|nr:hypothetical protein [Bacteroidaceae bacterium]